MTVTIQQTEKLLKGNQTFSLLGFSMLLMRLKNNYKKDPSPATVQTCMKEINTFIEKFKSIIAADYAIISKL